MSMTFRPDCGLNVHSYCKEKVANLCGINQKLLAEALSQVSQVCTPRFFLAQFTATIYIVCYFSNCQKSLRKSDEHNAGDVGVYQDVGSATADSGGEMCDV